MTERIAQLISYLIHPILMPSYALLIFFNMDSYISYSFTFRQMTLLGSLNLINTALMPALFLLVLRRLNRISDLHLKAQHERKLPFIVALFFYAFNFYIFKSSALPNIIVSMALAAALTVFASLLINFWEKVSIHSIAIASVAGIFFALSLSLNQQINSVLISLVVLVGLVGTARLKLEAHSPFQVYLGSFIGFVIGFTTVYFKLA